MREEADLLDHVADGAPQANRIPLARVPAPARDTSPASGSEQSIDELEDRRLAGAARADQRHDFAGVDSERESVENWRPAGMPERHLAELDAIHAITIERPGRWAAPARLLNRELADGHT